ncbi:MAG: penicillin acylase family protein [Actinobacteria bacterium]|jgi:penicillin amidase|nr:MAG: penicillin acylase family protein [Actinomycetota bacterium]
MRSTRAAYAKILAAMAALFPAAAASAVAFTRRALPHVAGELRLPGIAQEVRIDYDRWGVPHIRAHSLDDALFAQGFVTAQDRMVQLELMRRIGCGELAAVMGRKALAIDMFMRDIGLHRTACRIEGNLGDDTRRYLEDYSSGVNAYLCSRGKTLPLEVIMLAAGRPRPWTIVDGLVCLLFFAWTMDATWTADLMRGRLIRALGRERAEVLLPASGPGVVPVVDHDGERQQHRVEPALDCEVEFMAFDEDNPSWMVKNMCVHAQGSNNWVVGGSRTTTGKPLLCNDPHVQHTIPTLFYLCHVRSDDPQCDFIGASFPGIPGVLMGRNGHIAWGATSLCPDVVDLFIETFADGDSQRYKAGDGWMEADHHEETIRVFPGRKVKRKVVSTRHGPLIARHGDKGLSLKWAGHEAENDSAGCFVHIAMATNWKEFNSGLERYCGPAVNMVYADEVGNIGYTAAGRIPIREGHDGSVPLPGEDQRYDWRGYIPAAELPRVINPERGWIATANNQVVGGGYPYFITSMWEPSCRWNRIAELLEERERHGPHHMREMQGDVFTFHGSVLRREILRARENWNGASAQAEKAVDILAQWDCRATSQSVAQSVYFFTWRVLTERLLRHRLGHRMYFEYTTSFFNINHAVESILSGRLAEWLPPSAEDFDALLLQCLEEAVMRLQVRFGTAAMEEWSWGRLHSLEIPHFLAGIRPLGRLLNLGPSALGGDGETVNSAFSEGDPTIQVLARSALGGACDVPFLPRFHSDRVYAGPVFRMIVDLSAQGRSLWCLDTGQCANPLSPFYRNFFTAWKEIDYATMAFREDEVREYTRSTLWLEPGS